jgi:aspartate aminotransferase-like enzyme
LAATHSNVDPDGLLEYSVVFTDRSLNHMSVRFQEVMNDLSRGLKSVYGADAVAIVPGGGTYAMESVARQLATGRRALVIRNGWFSYRWSQILETGGIDSANRVLKARRTGPEERAPFEPAPIAEVEQAIAEFRPGVVFAPHVETAAGMVLPDEYLTRVARATHEAGGLFVLDCIASGALWLNMRELGVDVLISAPQKGWSASPCAGLVMLNDEAVTRSRAAAGTSFALDLNRWLDIMSAYEGGAHAYHATMPTDGLTKFRDSFRETEAFGFGRAREAQIELGRRVREMLTQFGFSSVAAPGFEAPGVVVTYTDRPDIRNGSRFAAEGLQVAAGVPLQCDEPADFSTFRIGLFGLDKLEHVDRTVERLQAALGRVVADG